MKNRFIPRYSQLIAGTSVLFLFFLIAGCSGCAGYNIHPGSIPVGSDQGLFDSSTADFLADENAFLISANKHSADYPPAVIQVLAAAETQYSITKASYLNWRSLQTTEAMNALIANKTQLQKSVTDFTAARSGAAK